MWFAIAAVASWVASPSGTLNGSAPSVATRCRSTRVMVVGFCWRSRPATCASVSIWLPRWISGRFSSAPA